MTSKNLSPQWLKFLKSLGIEFWLPLPLLGLSFWFVGGWLTEKTLSSYNNNDVVNLQAIQPNYGYGIASIKVDIYPNKGISLVTVKKAIKNQIITKYEKYEIILKTTDILSVEAEISKELGISRQKVRKMMRYRRQ
jgi:biotin operon repressor